MRPFAKLAVGSGADEKLGILAERNGLGGMTFLLSIPEAYPYGILPGSPRAYRAKVIPSAILSESDVEAAIDAQVEVGLVHRYEAGGHTLLYLVNYHRHQDVAWSKVRTCEYQLPDCWKIPDALQVMIDEGSLVRSKKQFGEYGVMGLSDAELEALGQVPPCPDVPPSASPVPPGAYDLPEAPDRQRGGTSTATATATANANGIVVGSTAGNDNDNDSLSGASDEAPTPEPSKEDQLSELREGVDAEDLALIDEFLDNAALENKTKRITPSRRVNETRDLLALREELGAGAWGQGMRAANRACAPNLNYVKKAASSYRAERMFDAPPKHKPKRLNPTGETLVGWEHLEK